MATRIRSIEKSNDLIGIRSRDLPAFRIVPQPTTLPRVPITWKKGLFIKMDLKETKCNDVD
jgi:hypothetical protein